MYIAIIFEQYNNKCTTRLFKRESEAIWFINKEFFRTINAPATPVFHVASFGYQSKAVFYKDGCYSLFTIQNTKKLPYDDQCISQMDSFVQDCIKYNNRSYSFKDGYVVQVSKHDVLGAFVEHDSAYEEFQDAIREYQDFIDSVEKSLGLKDYTSYPDTHFEYKDYEREAYRTIWADLKKQQEKSGLSKQECIEKLEAHMSSWVSKHINLNYINKKNNQMEADYYICRYEERFMNENQEWIDEYFSE